MDFVLDKNEEFFSNQAVIVGAGLAGLTAALNCARGGMEVIVLEKYGRPGGIPLAHPAVDVTPIEPDRVGKFIGVELGFPEVQPVQDFPVYFFGKKVQIPPKMIDLHCVERGHRDTAIDVQLYKLCVEAGVKFEFNHPVISQKDFAELPNQTIIATGLYFEAFEAFNRPAVQVFGYLGRGKPSVDFPKCGVWFHDYKLEYAYYGAANDALFSLYFAREPVDPDEFERWKETQFYGQEGMVCDEWNYYEGLVPCGAYNAPQFFAGNKILAGQVAAMADPFALFGVHGSLVSGKLAAMARLGEKDKAYDLFLDYNRLFNRNLFFRRRFNASPMFMKKQMGGPASFAMEKFPNLFKPATTMIFKALPGYKRLPK